MAQHTPGPWNIKTVGHNETGRLLEDFRREIDAVRWAKAQPEGVAGHE